MDEDYDDKNIVWPVPVPVPCVQQFAIRCELFRLVAIDLRFNAASYVGIYTKHFLWGTRSKPNRLASSLGLSGVLGLIELG